MNFGIIALRYYTGYTIIQTIVFIYIIITTTQDENVSTYPHNRGYTGIFWPGVVEPYRDVDVLVDSVEEQK